jgi:hypothetical protein
MTSNCVLNGARNRFESKLLWQPPILCRTTKPSPLVTWPLQNPSGHAPPPGPILGGPQRTLQCERFLV